VLRNDGTAVVLDTSAEKTLQPDSLVAPYDINLLRKADHQWGGAGTFGAKGSKVLAQRIGGLSRHLTERSVKVKPTDLWLEGGDVFGARTSDNRSVVLIGDNSVWLSVSLLHQRDLFQKRHVDPVDELKSYFRTSSMTNDANAFLMLLNSESAMRLTLKTSRSSHHKPWR